MKKSSYPGKWISIKVSETEYQELMSAFRGRQNQDDFKGIFWGRYLMSRHRARQLAPPTPKARKYFFRAFDLAFLAVGLLLGFVAGKLQRNAS